MDIKPGMKVKYIHNRPCEGYIKDKVYTVFEYPHKGYLVIYTNNKQHTKEDIRLGNHNARIVEAMIAEKHCILIKDNYVSYNPKNLLKRKRS